MTIQTKYNISDKVFIPELNINGTIISVYISDCGIRYNIRYFKDFDVKDCYFYEKEIEHYKSKEKEMGFKIL